MSEDRKLLEDAARAANGRISMFAHAKGLPTCETCPQLLMRAPGNGGWCQHSSNRVSAAGWPDGFTPSMAWDGSCELHPKRAAAAMAPTPTKTEG